MGKRLRSLFLRPGRKLKELRPELLQLREELEKISDHTYYRPLEMLVRFFTATSPWHDRGLRNLIVALEGVNYGQFGQVLPLLRQLERLFVEAGRSEFSLNRTKRGEAVTKEKVFLGGVVGLFTLPIPRWEVEEAKKPRRWEPGTYEDGLSEYEIVCRQAREFLDESIDELVKTIDFIVALT